MRLIDADELMEHVMRDKLDSKELIMQMIKNAPTWGYNIMTNMELFKQNLEVYVAAETFSEQNKLLKELQNIFSKSTISEKKEMLKLVIETGIDEIIQEN